MPEFVSGLPVHALVVHFVVVLLPLAVGGSVVIALWPAARERFGWLVVAVAVVATALVPVATNSGKQLKRRVGGSALLDEHERLGDQLLYYAIPMTVAVLGLMIVHELGKRRAAAGTDVSGGDAGAPTVTRTRTNVAVVVVAVVTIGLAVAAGIHVYRVGDAGSRVVWDFVQDTPPR
jgi:uncharacterized membrane protein